MNISRSALALSPTNTRLATLAGSVTLAYLWYALVSTPQEGHYIMAVNLIFHEAGHILFMPFGNFLYALGGTIGELAIPLIYLITFLRQRSYGGLLFSAWWLATALFSVGTYASDARSQVLPLLTGDPTTHDWTYLLGTLGLLPYDSFVGNFFHFLSYLALAYALWCAYHLLAAPDVNTQSYKEITTVPK